MKFSDFDLYNTVHDIYLEFERNQNKPRSADWLIYHRKRQFLCHLVIERTGQQYDEEKILKAWDDFGKNKDKYRLIVAVADRFGRKCFYSNRNKGECSHTVCVENIFNHGDPLLVEDCVISCRKHVSKGKG
ncbi:MAG: hypothetical protein DWQ19_11415 [Crenarchaeota archaeon]|nr:MAG: hypothetical protein DWQ19_11415 [Thermoproteota archaeon]